jgi:phenylpropionate dioxygenase-like ring-hydroxylating dioxygenase large terminal subunit
MAPIDELLASRIEERTAAREKFRLPGAGPLPTDLVQPFEVYDRERFDLEMLRVFARSWIWLGDTEDLTEPGDFITGTIGVQPVFVVRQEDGGLKGFLNACRHRASPVAYGDAGHCARAFTCPYHAWTYALDGRLRNVPDRRRMYGSNFHLEDYGLVPIRVGVLFDKLVWGCLSRKQVPLEDWVAPLLPRYNRYGFHDFDRFHRDLDDVYPINWKAFMENSNDDYHVRFVHKRLDFMIKRLETTFEVEGRVCSGYKPSSPDFDGTGGRTDLPAKDLEGFYADAVYPNLSPLPGPTELWIVRADPIAPDRTRLFSRVYGLNKSIEEQEFTMKNLEDTNLEDTAMVTKCMANLRSPLYSVGPPSKWETRALHIDRLVREDMATPLAEDEFVGAVD